MDHEDQQRFQVEAQTWHGHRGLSLHCAKCDDWTAILDSPSTLAELNQRADEHVEDCR